jgi:SM-20-related protein
MELILKYLDQNHFVVLDNFIDQNTSLSLLQNAQKQLSENLFTPAKIGKDENHELNTSIRSDLTLWIDHHHLIESEKIFFEKLQTLMTILNQNYFLGLKSYEAHYAYYEKGSFYKKHKDVHLKNSPRRFTFIHYLNENYQANDGGELVIYPEKEQPVIIQPKLGTTVFFFSEILAHEVKLAQKGRFSLTGWCRTDLF